MPTLEGATVALELVGVSARYEGAPATAYAALKGASLRVRLGEIVAVLGSNGAGKSTLLRVLAGTLLPATGEARLFGEKLASIDRRDIARKVAFVTQSEDVRFAFTVRDVVRMGRSPHQDGWMRPSAEDERVVSEALERFELDALADRTVDELSGGEKKRVAIARAFAQGGRVLLLDEPTAFLDVKHQVGLFEQLVEVVTSGEKASVLVTHDLQLAAAYATRVVLMKGGEVVADGGVDDVLTHDRLEATFDWPIAAGRLEGTATRVFAPGPRRGAKEETGRAVN